MISTLIKNAKILVNGKLVEKHILLENHKIREVIDEPVTVDKIIDVNHKLVIPGMIDCHVHFREPGMTHKEDFFTGSCAAAKGGVTTIMDMPNTKPPTTTVDLLKEKRELGKKSIVNYGLHFGATPDNSNEIRNAKGIVSTKVFMNQTTGDMMFERDENLQAAFKASRNISVHAEGETVGKALDIFKSFCGKKQQLYLCHISTKKELTMIRKFKKSNIHVEVTPHHLFLTVDDDKDAFTKMKPLLKTKEDQDALWNAIDKGLVATIGSDHAPHTIEEKKSEKFPYGVPGVETTLPLLLNAVNEKRLTLQKVIELTSVNPAKIYGLNKGAIAEGYDADLVVVDMELKKEVRNEEMLTKCKWSPFNGKLLKGWPVMTIVGGEVVYTGGKINDIKAKEITIK
ncbi:amidohydrolase family protein [Candidatus Woesearchaeota archaeon]|nr:amidohydrolase family protein [Candidatus Woesearchaeota archaeon]